MYKYESMRVKWSRCLEEESPRVARSIKNFFQHFYRNHRNFNFVVGQMFDGTTYLLVKPRNYRQIKEEIEKLIGKPLPEVAQMRNVNVLRKREVFQDFQSFKNFCKLLRDGNSEIVRRKKIEARKSLNKLRRALRQKPDALVLAFDLEVYEHDHSIILEIGYAMTTLNNPEDDLETFHYIIKENLGYANGDCVPDNRELFMFGTSRCMSLRRAAAEIQKHIDDADFLVAHSAAHDEEFLASCGVSVSGKHMFDTQVLAMALLPDGPPLYSLKRLLTDLKITFDDDILHNGGNDACYTLDVFLALAGLKEDNQRL